MVNLTAAAPAHLLSGTVTPLRFLGHANTTNDEFATRRRKLALHDGWGMEGNLHTLGYFSADVCVGTPPKTFNLIIGNPAQLAINTFVRVILSWIQLLGLPIGCGFLANLVLGQQGKAETMWPTIVVALMAYVIAKTFSLVFSCVLDTLFVCCCRDKQEYKGKYMPDLLREAFGFNKKGKKGKKGDKAEEGEAEEGEGAKEELVEK